MWWTIAGMEQFVRNSDSYRTEQSCNYEVVRITEVQPPLRKDGELWFRNRNSVIEVLTCMRTGVPLEPIEVWSREKTRSTKYIVRDGFHRFYLSVVVGYPRLPIRINDFDLAEFLEKERNGQP